MDSGTISFLIWCMFGSMFFGFAAYAWVSVKPVGFWANANVFEVTDISKYIMLSQNCSAFLAL